MKPTPQQRKIIDHPLEPLRVTAGAGTGKTTTMAWRLAAQVRSGAVEPERTLGITFTNKAARELSDGIRKSLIGLVESGREVQVTTYHGFAFSIVREFGPLLGIPRTVHVATPGYVRKMLRDAVGSQPRTHLDLTRLGPVVDQLLGLSSKLGDHLRHPADLRTAGVAGLAPARAEIADVLEDFERRKHSLRVVDFADLVSMAHEIITGQTAIADRLRSRYQLVLLDEYQDTNPGQRQLLLTLFGDGFPVTAVGDSDQTIYEWRGASPENFERFPEHFRRQDGSPAASLDLATSWRSGEAIVAVANAVRSEISQPGPLPALLSRRGAEPGSVVTHWVHSSVAEAAWITSEVTQLHSDGRRWADIAILFRKHRQMATIRDALANAGIPVEVASMGGLLEVPEVTDLYAWLRIIGMPDDAPALMRLLLGSRYRLGLGDLAPLAAWVRRRHRTHEEAPIGWALLEAVDALETVEGLTDEATHRLVAFRSEYRYLLEVAQGVSLVELCRRILDQTGTWPEIEALPDAARLSARLNLHRFLDLAESWSPLEGAPSLDAFLDHLKLLTDDSVGTELDTVAVSGEDAVTMLTIHGAKGLEWPVVFLPALVEGTFPSGVHTFEDPIERPEILPYELRLDRDTLVELSDDRDERRATLRTGHRDQEWRTAYVAVTRAASVLNATGAYWYTDGKPRKPSRLFEVIDSLGVQAPGRVADAGEAPETLRLRVDRAAAPDPHFTAGHIAAVRDAIDDPSGVRRLATRAGIVVQYDAAVDQLALKLSGLPTPVEVAAHEEFRTSVTGLVAYAACGLRFRWQHIDRLPRRPSTAARRGVAVHRRIELHHRGAVSFDAPGLTDDDRPAVSGPHAESAYQRFLDSRFASARPILVETPFALQIGEATVSGRIDAVYESDPGSWEIVDFKTGRPSHHASRRVQLEAYAIAAADVRLQGRPQPNKTTVTFAYLGGDRITEESEPVDGSWLAKARDHLDLLVGGAESGPYEPEPGDACRHCDFVRFCDAGAAWLEANS